MICIKRTLNRLEIGKQGEKVLIYKTIVKDVGFLKPFYKCSLTAIHILYKMFYQDYALIIKTFFLCKVQTLKIIHVM